MTDQCSIWAYQDILESGKIGRLHGMYLSIFSESGKPLTVHQVIERFKLKFKDSPYKTHHGFGSRISELTEIGFLKKYDTVRCEHSNQIVNRWIWTGRKIPKIKSIRRICCPKCEGKGKIDVFEYLDL